MASPAGNSYTVIFPGILVQAKNHDNRSMIQQVLAVGPLACNCSVLGDEETREGIVIDPGADLPAILEAIDKLKLTVKAIVLTHGHVDHVGAAAGLKRATQAPVMLNKHDYPVLSRIGEQAAWLGMPSPEPVDIETTLEDGDQIWIGNIEFSVLHTPGHTPGSISLWASTEKLLVAGDTLFRESIGRTDLPGGDSRQILVSLREKILPLAPETTVITGHGPLTTLAHEKRFNYFLQRT